MGPFGIQGIFAHGSISRYTHLLDTTTLLPIMTYISRLVSFISRVAPRTIALLAITALVIGGVILPTTARAAGKTFYVSSSDTTASDTNTGLSATTAWKSIARVNTALTAGTITAGDTVYFKRGDSFYGTGLTMARAGAVGSPIVFTSSTSYGTGNKPVISGFTPITSGWTSVGTNLWEITAPAGVDNLSTMIMNGTVMPLGRFPKATAANGGYLAMTYNATTGNNVTFTDSTGSIASLANLAGAEVVTRPNHWTAARGTILSHSGNTLTLSQRVSSYNLATGIGFFVQNSPTLLTQNGEWAYIPANVTTSTPAKIRLYYVGTPATAYFSSVDKLVNLLAYDYLTFSNITFEGAKSYGFYGDSAAAPTIDGNDIRYSGQYAVWLNYGSDVKVTNNIITDSQNSGVYINSGGTLANATVTGNTITNTGIRMGTSTPLVTTDRNMTALFISMPAGTNLVQYNKITNVGNNGIRFNGNNLTIKNNVISNFNLQLDDGAGIYAYGGSNSVSNPNVTQYTNRLVTENVVYNGVGAPYGTTSNTRQSSGIYMDNNMNHVDITNNTLFDLANKGMPLNSPQNMSVTGNNIFNTNGASLGICRWMNDGSQTVGGQDPKNLRVTGNTFFNVSPGQVLLSYCDFGIKQTNPSSPTGVVTAPTETLATRLRSMAPDATTGTYFFDKNIYRSIDQAVVNNDYQISSAGPYANYPDFSIQSWRKVSNHDLGSTVIPAKTYKVNSTIATLYNSTLDALTGITIPTCTPVAPATTCLPTSSVSIDSTGKLGSGNAGRVVVNTLPPTNQVTYKAGVMYASLSAPISPTKKYLVKFSTIGNIDGGMVKVGLGKGGTLLTPYQYAAIGTDRVDHEFLFVNAPTSGTSNGSWRIEFFEALVGTYYIDNIQVTEVDATVLDPNADVVFEYNETTSPRTVVLPSGTYYDVRDTAQTTPISGSITIAPFRSIILNKTAGLVTDTTAPTVVIASPAASSVLSGTATVTATASDNVALTKVEFYQGTTLIGTSTTAPYSTTWNTAVVANGTYTLKAVATDSSNNQATSATVSVTVANLDTTAPVVSLTAPVGGVTLSSTTTLIADASDAVGVTAVSFYAGSTLLGTDTSAPYTTPWDTTGVANGTYTLKVIASDAAGNTTTSGTVTVTVANTDTTAPIVSVSSPSAGSVLSGIATLTATATDNVGISRVDLYVGSTLMGSDTTIPYTATWDTTKSTNSTFGLKAIAYDITGNKTTSSSVVVSVNNVVVPAISVSISTPTTGSTISGTTAFTAIPTGTGITGVDFYKDSDTTAFASSSASPYTVFLNTATLTNGSHTFKAVAKTATASTTSATIAATVANTVVTTPSAPTNVVAVSGYTKVKVQWNAPLTNGGAAITSYKVTSTPGNVTVSSATSPAIVTGLTNGTAYTFAVQALNSVGTGATATSASVAPVANFTVGSRVIVSTTSSSLTVRKTASTNGTRVGTVTNGTVGTVTQTGTGWTKVQFPTMLGWVSSTYLFSN